MKLTEMSINDFSIELASSAPAPGGGSASALAASMGIALTKMVAELTTGREKYKEHESLVQEIISETKALLSKSVDLIDKDTEAYSAYGAAAKMPKETAEEKEVRKNAMQMALKNSTAVPFELMELCLSAVKIAQKALGKTNVNTLSDIGVAAINLRSAVQGAWLNVLINIPGIKDENFANNHRERGLMIVNETVKIADELFEKVKSELL